MKHVVIIGNGIAGTTAARWIRKLSDHRITIISSESKHFYSRTALMYIYMGHMRQEDTKPYEDWFWDKNRIDLVQAHVIGLNSENKILSLDNGEVINYDKLIIATGSKTNFYGWKGQDFDGVRGLYSLQDLDYMESYSDGLQRAVIVGGGLIGIEMAEMFHSRHIPVTMLVRESSYWNGVLPHEESQMVTDHIRSHGIDLRLGVNLEEILPDSQGKVAAVRIKETGEEISCGYVGITAGVSPNIDWLKDSPIETAKGILVDEHLQTNIQDIYAIGDCAQLSDPRPGRRPVEAIWYTGRMMGETVAYTICDKPTSYDPGLWFNSAKFFDIEYQVYGYVPSSGDDQIQSIYHENLRDNKAIRINYDKESKAVVGFNLMGIRYRHEVCEKWIKEKTSIEQVLTHLSMANFDPEFFKQYEPTLIQQYNRLHGTDIKLASKRGLRRVLSFLKSSK